MADELPLDRDDVVTIMGALFDIRVGVRHIIGLFAAWVSTPSARLVGADGSRAEPAILEAGIASDALEEDDEGEAEEDDA